MATASRGNGSALRATGSLPPESIVFGRTPALQAIRENVDKVAAANLPVLIRGESGTGKEIIARLIHQRSPWQAGPFVKVNCPAIPGTLVESELFGYEKGAFTGAYGNKPGRVEQAHGGTLFLDEISELDPELQAKLLQLLQDGQFARIGGQEDTRVEVRVVCATNRRLEEELENGGFRQDLFYRINVVSLEMPPLRRRSVDIADLIQYFLDFYNEKYNCRTPAISAQCLALCQSYHWPGNIRELENLIKRYVVLGSEECITSEFSREPQDYEPEIPLDGAVPLKKLTRQAVRDLERKVILRVLQANHWNRKRAAQLLSISYRALLYKLKDAGVVSKRTAVGVGHSPASDD